MSAKILGGKEIAEAIKSEVSTEVSRLRREHGFVPGLAVVRVGDDPASAVYVKNKVKATEAVGLNSEHIHLPVTTSQTDLLGYVNALNARDAIDGILVQLPLPEQIEGRDILEAIDPEKDVDGFHPINVGRLSQGEQSLAPCTPAGVIEILKRSNIKIAGQNAVIVGRSNIVGKPMAMLLLHENATVTLCHSRTRDLAAVTRQADILVAAIGRAGFIRGEHIREGATVIDVGINRTDEGLTGDVDFDAAAERAGAITPVPGGVGPMTIAMLLRNTLSAAQTRRRSAAPAV